MSAVQPFVTFDAIHISVLVLLLILFFFLIGLCRAVTASTFHRWTVGILVVVLLGAQVVGVAWHLITGTFTAAKALPLELCHITATLAAFFFFQPSQGLYDIVFFWATAGAIQGLLTPYIGEYGFPHFWFFQFFLWHFSIVFAWGYMTYVMGYRPRLKAFRKLFFLTNGVCIPIVLVNLATGGNYFFLMAKPATPSIIDYLGPWPYYFLSLQVVGTGSFFVYYALVRVVDRYLAAKETVRRAVP